MQSIRVAVITLASLGAICLSASTAAVGSTPTPEASVGAAQSSAATGLEPLLELAKSKACPNPTDAEIQDAAASIKTKPGRTTPDSIASLWTTWINLAIYWGRVNAAVLIGIIVFGALAAAIADEAVWWKKWKTIAALIATVLAGVNTTMAPAVRHQKYEQAWVVLNTTKAAYETNPNVTICDVGKAVALGESIIHKGE